MTSERRSGEHVCGACGRPVSAHPVQCWVGEPEGAVEGHRHFPPVCCPGCPCGSSEQAHLPAGQVPRPTFRRVTPLPPEPDPVLSDKQLRELNVTVRHLGRALESNSRAAVDIKAPRLGSAPGWVRALWDYQQALIEASNRLVDALEGYDAAQRGETPDEDCEGEEP